MRSPNHLEIKSKCKEAIPKLLEQFDILRTDEIIPNNDGWVNPCFYVGDDLVFRFNARDPSLPKFEREKIIFNRLSDSEIPVPKVVAFDNSKKLIEYEVLICERLKGQSIEQNWSSLESDLKQSLASQAGKMMSQLHKEKFDFYGEIANSGPFPKTKSWKSYLEFKLGYHLDGASELGIFSSEVTEKFKLVFNAYASIFDKVSEPRLVHVDFHLGNLLYSGSSISGVLDFEWALAGDPLYDFGQWTNADENWPGSQRPFFEGYNKSLTADEEKRLSIYRMTKNVELSVVASLHFEAEEAESYKQTTYQHMITLLENLGDKC